MHDTARTRKQTQGLDVIEEIKQAKGLDDRLEKVEQDQPLPTYQKEEQEIGRNSDNDRPKIFKDNIIEDTARFE